MSERSSLGRFGVLVWRVLPVLVVAGFLAFLLAPADSKHVKKAGLTVVYFAGVPMVLGAFALYSEKKGWLK